MSANIPGGLMNELVQRRFQIICINCDALGIVFDCVEDAASSTLIKCRGCGAPRGTLGISGSWNSQTATPSRSRLLGGILPLRVQANADQRPHYSGGDIKHTKYLRNTNPRPIHLWLP